MFKLNMIDSYKKTYSVGKNNRDTFCFSICLKISGEFVYSINKKMLKHSLNYEIRHMCKIKLNGIHLQ